MSAGVPDDREAVYRVVGRVSARPARRDGIGPRGGSRSGRALVPLVRELRCASHFRPGSLVFFVDVGGGSPLAGPRPFDSSASGTFDCSNFAGGCSRLVVAYSYLLHAGTKVLHVTGRCPALRARVRAGGTRLIEPASSDRHAPGVTIARACIDDRGARRSHRPRRLRSSHAYPLPRVVRRRRGRGADGSARVSSLRAPG